MKKGYIAIYGTNNLGKTTQLELLQERCDKEGKSIHTQKYPIYDLVPTGPLIFGVMKKGNPLKIKAGELQALTAKNRFDYQQTVRDILNGNSNSPYPSSRAIIAEMYTGTGIAFGLGDRVKKEFLLAVNEGLLIPDVSILFDGERFKESIEEGHRYEENDKKTIRIRKIHQILAKEMGWHIINANRTREEIHEEIWGLIKDFL